jgi:hypothetical protein
VSHLRALGTIGASVLVVVLCVKAVEPLARAEEKPAAQESDKARPALSDKEQKLVAMLENATLSGKWRLVEDGKLGKEADDTYTIHSIEKARGDVWIVKARIKYGDKDLTLPVPVEVHWAADTPVLSVTDRGLPGLGTYTARVLFYDGYYTGTWSGPGHAGFLSGTIVKAAAAPESKPDPQK